MQLFVSALLITFMSMGSTFMSFPKEFSISGLTNRTPWDPYLCTIIGLWSGFLIGNENSVLEINIIRRRKIRN
jgi:hypothetical protein